MPKIGILFDIDELESALYGYAAYQIFFESVDTRRLAGCSLSDGDTNATLAGRANQYCIAVESPDPSRIATVKNALSGSNAKGLLPLASRFVEDALVSHEPLVLATHINAAGELVGCQTGWVMEAWQKSQERHRNVPISKNPFFVALIADLALSLTCSLIYLPFVADIGQILVLFAVSALFGLIPALILGRIVTRAKKQPTKPSSQAAVDMLVALYDKSPNGEGFLKHSVAAEPVRDIGRKLDEQGGFDLMVEVHTRFAEKRPRAKRNLEMVWDGIGSWMG